MLIDDLFSDAIIKSRSRTGSLLVNSKRTIGMFIAVVLMTGCATFKGSDLELLVKGGSRSDSNIMDLPVRVRYFSNYDSGNDERQSRAYAAVKSQIESYYSAHKKQPVFIEGDHEPPLEYLDYYVVADRYNAKLDMGGVVSSIFCGLSLMILPGNMHDIDYYIRMSHFSDGKLVSRNLYMQPMDQYVGLFIAPWSHREYETIGAESIQDVFLYQYSKED